MIYSRSSLQPRNEVWGKVMFSQVFVGPRGGSLCPSMHHRSHDQGVSVHEGLCPRGVSVRGSLSMEGVSVHGGESLSIEGVSVHGRDLRPWKRLAVPGVSVRGVSVQGVSVRETLIPPERDTLR